MAMHNKLGKNGELAAINYLRGKNYIIRATNWRHHHLELDIIAETPTEIVFVEVKTRSTSYWGEPYTCVNDTKMRNIVNAASAYLNFTRINKDCRFDIIGLKRIGFNNGEEVFDIKHIENAFVSPVW